MSLAKKDWSVSRSEYRINGIRMIPTEEEEQKTVISWCRLHEARWPELGLIYHVPNEGQRSKRAGAAEKAMGMRRGVADLCLPVAKSIFHGMYLELKALDGKLTKEQEEFLTAVSKEGYFCCACFGADVAVRVIEWYMGGRPCETSEGVKVF